MEKVYVIEQGRSPLHDVWVPRLGLLQKWRYKHDATYRTIGQDAYIA